MNKSNKAMLPLVASFLVIAGLLLGIRISNKTGGSETEYVGSYGQKLSDIIAILDTDYVDSIDKKKLFEKTITHLLHDLDPHSNYIAAEDLAEMNESIQGKFGGIGIRFSIYDDTLNVINVVEGSPAYHVGIQKFDQITSVEGENIANVGLTNEQVRKMLKGMAGTPVNLTIARGNEILEKKIVRGDVPIESINAYYMLTSDVGYIRLSSFSMQSANEFYLAALTLRQQGMKNLIFDLRYNGGGVLGSAVSILETMLENGTPIVSTQGKNSPEKTIYAEGKPFLKDIGVAVLINSGSASASEIVAGAIQDNDRGVIIGRRSFGKGLVQQDIRLKDGSNLRLTVSRYYTPTGRCIQKTYSGDYEDYLMDEIHRYENGELYHIDSSLRVDSLKYVTPKGKIVYGGGGIMPDIFVPLDTTGNSFYYRKLQYTNAFNEYAYQFARFHDLGKYKSLESFYRDFQVSESMLKDFVAYSEKKYEIPFNEKDFASSKMRIKENIKAEIARQEWLELGVFYVLNKRDKEVAVALDAFK